MEIQLSAVILAHRDERHIGTCLESVRAIADEILVVDSSSSESTAVECKNYEAVYFQRDFQDTLEQKKWALTHASFPCVLLLRANEYLTETLIASISRVKKNWKYDAYQFSCVYNYCGKWIRHGSLLPRPVVRLWDSRKGSWEGISPYEQFVPEPGATKSFLQGALHHYSHHSLEEHVNEIIARSNMAAGAYHKLNRPSRITDFTLRPFGRFLRDYILKLGFLDGFLGLQLSVNSAHERFLTFVKLRDMNRTRKDDTRETICFFNTNLAWGGGEKYYFEFSNSLHSSGHPVILFTNSTGELKRRLSETNMTYYAVHVSNLSFLNPLKILQIARILRKERVRVILMNLSTDMKVAGLASKFAGVDRIIYRRGSAIPVRNTFLNRFLFRHVLDEILANSYETKRTLLKNNPRLIDPARIRVIYNGLRLDQFESAGTDPRYLAEGEEVVLGNAGRLVRQKAQEYLIDLAVELKKRKRKFKILIAGEGPLEKQLRAYASASGVEDSIVFLGFVDDMKSFLASIDVFVLTSRWEGFGYVIVEAMASGRPVVAFDISSNPEIIEEGKSGFLVPPFNIYKLTDRVQELIQNGDLRRQMGACARDSAYQRFDFNIVYRSIEEYLKER